MSTNPYQTPEGQLSTDDLSYGEVKFFSPSTRINRLRYWAHGALIALAAYALIAIGGALTFLVSPVIGIAIMVIAYIAIMVFSVILMIQRLHDLNKTGWMWLLSLVPFANIYLLIILIFFKGTPGGNNYGLQPPPSKTWHWILALGFPVLILVVLFAVALPQYNAYLENMQGASGYPQDQLFQYENDGVDQSLYSDEAVVDGIPQDDDGYNSESVDDDSETDE